MKFLLILLLIGAFIVKAESLDTCYTVQLTSKHNSLKNLNLLNATAYPESCVVMEIGSSLTVRCGCYEEYIEAKNSFQKLTKEYTTASIATTYKHRFEINKDIKEDTKKIEEKKVIEEKKEEQPKQKKLNNNNLNNTCYTVQLVSRSSSQRNLDLLTNSTYPQNCKLMEIGNSLTVRCGCYEQLNSAKESLVDLNTKYKNATVVTTYSHRFDSNVKIKSTKSTSKRVL